PGTEFLAAPGSAAAPAWRLPGNGCLHRGLRGDWTWKAAMGRAGGVSPLFPPRQGAHAPRSPGVLADGSLRHLEGGLLDLLAQVLQRLLEDLVHERLLFLWAVLLFLALVAFLVLLRGGLFVVDDV